MNVFLVVSNKNEKLLRLKVFAAPLMAYKTFRFSIYDKNIFSQKTILIKFNIYYTGCCYHHYLSEILFLRIKKNVTPSC